MATRSERAEIEIRALADKFARYKKLVDSDWNKRTFQGVVELFDDVVRGAESRIADNLDLADLLVHAAERRGPIELPQETVKHLRYLSFLFHEPHVPEMPEGLTAGKSKTREQTDSATVYLLLQAMIRVTGEDGFFRDLQSLLYLNAVHYLLPLLEKSGPANEHAWLANVLHIHPFIVWRDEPAHMFYLLAALMGQLGQSEARLQYLFSSLAATPIDDHSYLTKASAYWSELIELGQQDNAMDFLLKLTRNAPEPFLDEIREMIKETADIKGAA